MTTSDRKTPTTTMDISVILILLKRSWVQDAALGLGVYTRATLLEVENLKESLFGDAFYVNYPFS